MSVTAESWTVEVLRAFLIDDDFSVAIILDNLPNGRAINGTLGARRRAELFDLGENYEGSVWVEAAKYPHRIETGGTITVDRKEYEIVGTSRDALGAILRIDYGERFAA